MLKIVGLFLVLSACCIADTLDLGKHGVLTVDVPAGWKFSTQQIPDRGYAAALRPESGENAGVKLSVIYLPNSSPIDPASLRSQLEKVAEQYVATSVEQKIDLKKFGVASGYGEYVVFTDASLVGKPEQKGNFKFIAPGLVKVSDDCIIAVTIVGDDPAGSIARQMLESVASIKITPSK